VSVALPEIASDCEDATEAAERAITDLSNNAGRMKDAGYRQAGLPITTAPLESIQKQINRRIKAMEKFWC